MDSHKCAKCDKEAEWIHKYQGNESFYCDSHQQTVNIIYGMWDRHSDTVYFPANEHGSASHTHKNLVG